MAKSVHKARYLMMKIMTWKTTSRGTLRVDVLKLRDFFTNYKSNSSLRSRLCTFTLKTIASSHRKMCREMRRVKMHQQQKWGRFGPSFLSNKQGDLSFWLWELAGEEPIITQISKRKWRWIGHILRKPANNITRQALRWNPQGKRKRGRPRNSWRRGVESQMRNWGHTWATLGRFAQDRTRWRTEVVNGLCSNRS